MMPLSERVYEIALFGSTGCGKSSVVNLLAEKPVADVATGLESGTKRARWYPISLAGKTFRLWDTMGFDQAEREDTDPLSPYEQAHTLLRNFHEGVDLILLCARKDGFNASLRGLYWLLNDFFFAGQARIALVLTHFDALDEQWWGRNKNTIVHRCDISTSLPYACITTVQTSSQPDSVYDQSKRVLQALLQDIITFPSQTLLRFDLSSDSKRAAATQRLSSNCSLSARDATTLVERFTSPKGPFNAILVGESGVGKSSIVNLLTGHAAAKISSGAGICTSDPHSYTVSTGLHQFLIWDTVGFDGTWIWKSTLGVCIESATRLVRELQKQDGIDLIIFCKKGGWVSLVESDAFQLVYEILCEGQIPVAFIITHLENHNPMEDWWKANESYLRKVFNLKTNAVAGHACITSIDPDTALRLNSQIQDKVVLSRVSVQAMLEDSISYCDIFRGNRDLPFFRRLVGMVVGTAARRERITVQGLKEHHGLNKGQAEELVKLLYTLQD